MKISHGAEYLALLTITRLAQLIPGRLADWMAVAFGILSYLILTSRRRIARENLKRAFKDEKNPQEIEKIVREVFVNVARTVVEFARQPVMEKDEILSMVAADGEEYFAQVLAEGKGAMLVSGHFGNWEFLGGWLAAKGYQVDLLVGEQHNKKVDDLLMSFRKSFGVGIIPIGVASRHVMKSLRANRMVAVISDQHAASGGAIVQFFDRPAATPKGPAAFAAKVGCPIIAGCSLREGYKKYHLTIFPPIYPPNTGDNERDILEMTQRYTSYFENFIRKYPSQWMWTHRRWKLD